LYYIPFIHVSLLRIEYVMATMASFIRESLA